MTGSEPPTTVIARARRLDAQDAIDCLWVNDERFRRDVWVSLGMLAVMTRRLRLATCVTDPFIRHPALTASAIATLDELSDGRAVLGLGAGASGFGALRITRSAPATAIRESVDLMRRLWDSQGERVTYAGRTITFEDDRLHYPVRRRVPIYIAGRGPRILQIAGELGDGVVVGTFTGGTLLDYALHQVEAGEKRRNPRMPPPVRVAWVYLSVGEDREAARRAVRQGIAVALWGSRPILEQLGITLPEGLATLFDSAAYSVSAEVIGRAAALVPEALIDDCSVAGTPEECAQKLRALAEHSFDHVAIWPFPPEGADLDSMIDLLVARVIPLVRGDGVVPTG